MRRRVERKRCLEEEEEEEEESGEEEGERKTGRGFDKVVEVSLRWQMKNSTYGESPTAKVGKRSKRLRGRRRRRKQRTHMDD